MRAACGGAHCRDLLRDAMDVATTQKNFPRPNAHHLSLRKKLPQRSGCGAIVARIKKWHDNAAVRGVEVDIARRQSLSGATRETARTSLDATCLPRSHCKWARHRQFVDSQASAAGVARVVQPLPGISRDRVLWIAPIIGPRKTHHAGPHEARELVYMTIGLIVEHSFAEPYDRTHPEVVPQVRFDARTT